MRKLTEDEKRAHRIAYAKRYHATHERKRNPEVEHRWYMNHREQERIRHQKWYREHYVPHPRRNYTSILQIDGVTFAKDPRYDKYIKEADTYQNPQLYHETIKKASRYLKILNIKPLEKYEK